ncbi:hypothetical protein VNO77_39988 [Canavalia gladiata]|uniref:Uncharacterized protein n=1 Tax=Canavalia gladiata TaxID=3824 RepID=A0AAN9JX49_CANGL
MIGHQVLFICYWSLHCHWGHSNISLDKEEYIMLPVRFLSSMSFVIFGSSCKILLHRSLPGRVNKWMEKLKKREEERHRLKAMNLANSPLCLPFFFFFFTISPFRALGHQTDWNSEETHHGNGFGRRVLMSFKEKPSGSNVTFECAPSGPCVPCLYSEKGDEKYRCSETGYRIPFKCVEMKGSTKNTKKTTSQKSRSSLETSDSNAKSHKVSHDAGEFTSSQSHRTLLDDSSSSDNSSQAYITYRSCIPPVSEEKLSVLHFEGLVIFLLLISGSIIYLRKKKAVSVSGYVPVRVQTNSILK